MDETQSEKLQRKMREAPFVPAGVAACIGALCYGAYKYKHRGTMSRSLFFVQLRVGAQGMVDLIDFLYAKPGRFLNDQMLLGEGSVVGSLCIGIVVSMFHRVKNLVTSKDQ